MTCLYFPVFLILLDLCLFTSGLQCRGENNENLDWFTVYKIPKIHHDNNLIQNGVGYIYVTSEDYEEWKLSKFGIDDSESIIAKTLEPFYSTQNYSHLLYNDQPPNEPSKSEKGHTKGVILADLDSGYWLIHSVPHFVEPSSHYKYPKSGIKEGQSFLCLSLDLKNLNKIGIQLQYNEPQIYSSFIPEELKTKLSEIVEAAAGTVVRTAPWYNEVTITSKSGVKFYSFAKSKKFGKDLYHDWVSPTFGSDLLTETWLNGNGRLPSNCTNSLKVYNIETISIPGEKISFSSSEDHSKWAVGVHSPWICIGDINRMHHQMHRGGGTVCQNKLKLTEKYRNSVESIEKCLSNIF